MIQYNFVCDMCSNIEAMEEGSDEDEFACQLELNDPDDSDKYISCFICKKCYEKVAKMVVPK